MFLLRHELPAVLDIDVSRLRGRHLTPLQVVGLANCDFTLLNREIQYANRRERINIISKYMDYRLRRVEENKQVPKDALNIAKMLGLSSEIIDRAKNYIK